MRINCEGDSGPWALCATDQVVVAEGRTDALAIVDNIANMLPVGYEVLLGEWTNASDRVAVPAKDSPSLPRPYGMVQTLSYTLAPECEEVSIGLNFSTAGMKARKHTGGTRNTALMRLSSTSSDHTFHTSWRRSLQGPTDPNPLHSLSA